MAREIINVGTNANDSTGDPLRTAFQKLNNMTAELYTDDASDVNSIVATAPIARNNATGIVTISLNDAGIVTDKIADDAVTTDKLANAINSAITANTAKVTNATHTGDVTGSGALTIVDDKVITSKILDANVTTAKIADDAVTADKLANSINGEIAANTAKLTNATHTGDVTGSGALTIGNNKVITAKILDANITTAKIANDAINGDKIADDSIGAEHIADNAVGSAAINDDIAGNGLSISNGVLSVDAIAASGIASDAVITAKILDNNVTTAKIANAAIGPSEIADNAVKADGLFVTGNGSNGQALTSDGDGTFSWTTLSSGIAVSVISGNTNAASGYLYVLTANLTLTLPSSPSAGDYVKISNRSGVATCVVARNSKKIMGATADLTLDKLNSGFEMVYSGTAQGWILIGVEGTAA